MSGSTATGRRRKTCFAVIQGRAKSKTRSLLQLSRRKRKEICLAFAQGIKIRLCLNIVAIHNGCVSSAYILGQETEGAHIS